MLPAGRVRLRCASVCVGGRCAAGLEETFKFRDPINKVDSTLHQGSLGSHPLVFSGFSLSVLLSPCGAWLACPSAGVLTRPILVSSQMTVISIQCL